MSVLILAKLESKRPAQRVRRVRLEAGRLFVPGPGAMLHYLVERGTQPDGSDTLLLELRAMGLYAAHDLRAIEPRFRAPLDGGDLHLVAVEFDRGRVQAIHIEVRDRLESIHAIA